MLQDRKNGFTFGVWQDGSPWRQTRPHTSGERGDAFGDAVALGALQVRNEMVHYIGAMAIKRQF